MNRLLRTDTAMAVFLVAKLIKCISLGVVAQSNEVWAIFILTMLVYGVIAWFAHKRQIISIWAMVIIMFYEGVDQVSMSLGALGSSPVLNVLALVVAVYVILGGMALFVNRNQRGQADG